MSDTKHHYQDLITLFNDCFEKQYQVKLVKGQEEPLYLPAHADQPYHAIFFAHGYFSSALHECAHWLIAGVKRRELVDYGYWYAPDGRNAEQQECFQQVEVKPQALEWILSVAAGHSFKISIDNLNASSSTTDTFAEAIYQQVVSYCQQGLSLRAQCFRKALTDFYGTSPILAINQFKLD